jgi:predicted metal-dependent hydrolase
MNLAQLLSTLESPIVIRPTRRMNQRTRWGSCTAHGRVSLNCKLLFLPRELVRYVIAHELCHTLESNHSSRFWAHLRQFEPRSDALHGKMRDAWKLVPTWAQRGYGSML